MDLRIRLLYLNKLLEVVMKKIVSFVFAFMLAACSVQALPTPSISRIGIDAYTDSNGVGFFLYWHKGGNCADLTRYTDAQKLDPGLPTRSADGLRDEWVADPAWGLKATTCTQMTAYDVAGNESQFASVAVLDDNRGWYGIDRGNNYKNQ